MTVWLDLYRYRDLFLNLFRRELRAKYKGSVLGIAWSLVYPLALVGVYTLLFSVLLPTSTVDHYPLFLVSGLLDVGVLPGVDPGLVDRSPRACEPRQAGALPASAAAALGRRDEPRHLRRDARVVLPITSR